MSILVYDQIRPQKKWVFIPYVAEFPSNSSYTPIFTVLDEKEGYISLKRLFVEHVSRDPTEYEFAMALAGNWDYWAASRQMFHMKPYYPVWVREAAVLRKSNAFTTVFEQTEKGNFQAAKYLIEQPWEGRTAKARASNKATAKEAFERDEHQQNLKRLQQEGLLN